MPFPEELTTIMQKRNITAQDIAKNSRGSITVSDIRRFQKGACPTSYQVMFLNNIFGIDFELIISPPDKSLVPARQLGISVSEFGKVEAIGKPGKTIKPKEVNILKPPKNKECRWCDIETGTECYRHAEDEMIKYLSGGGCMGMKIPDQFTVWGCQKCDDKYSIKPNRSKYILTLEHSLKWAIGIIKTWLM